MKIVFENNQLLVLDKPSGVVVNKSQTTDDKTLQDELFKYFKLKAGDLGIGGRAGIVHRLDRETSGLLVVAKTKASYQNLQNQFAVRQVDKEYLALVHGKVPDSRGSIEVKIGRIGKFGKFGVSKKRDIGGRETTTDYQVVKRYKFSEQKLQKFLYSSSEPLAESRSIDHWESSRQSLPRVLTRGSNNKSSFTKSRITYLKNHALDYTYIKVMPKTGRTHQIRVALTYIGHPVASALIYAPGNLSKFDKMWCPRLFLHSTGISFNDPKSGKKVSFKSPLPQDLRYALGSLLT